MLRFKQDFSLTHVNRAAFAFSSFFLTQAACVVGGYFRNVEVGRRRTNAANDPSEDCGLLLSDMATFRHALFTFAALRLLGLHFSFAPEP